MKHSSFIEAGEVTTDPARVAAQEIRAALGRIEAHSGEQNDTINGLRAELRLSGDAENNQRDAATSAQRSLAAVRAELADLAEGARAEGSALEAERQESGRLRQHSIILNRIGFALAESVGLDPAQPFDVEALVESLICSRKTAHAEIDAARAHTLRLSDEYGPKYIAARQIAMQALQANPERLQHDPRETGELIAELVESREAAIAAADEFRAQLVDARLRNAQLLERAARRKARQLRTRLPGESHVEYAAHLSAVVSGLIKAQQREVRRGTVREARNADAR